MKIPFLLLSLSALALTPTVHADDRPNIVLIMADDMGYECVGANGSKMYKTPHLDELASQGVRFEHGHSQPICTPSRVQIMSGLYNSRNYVGFGILQPGTRTFANMLKEAGYATCVVGKWQLNGGYGGPKVGGFEAPKNFGFDEYCLWQVTRTQNQKPNRFPNPGLEINGKEVDYKNGEYGPDIVSDYACDFIRRQAEADKLFLLYYPMMLPHWPFEPTPDSDDWDPISRQGDATEKRKPGDLTSLPHFIDMVAYTDKIVGKLLKQLEDAGIRENTLIIFTGDNGVHYDLTSTFKGQPYPGGKGKTTLNATHVPLIIDWPGQVKKGSVCDDLVDFTDMLPTMLDAAGVAMPEGFKPDGRSFLPQMRGEAGEPREWIYCWHSEGPKQTVEFAMTKRYKLYKGGRFYDLETDFWERTPIKPEDRTAEQQRIARKLMQAMERHTRQAAPAER